MHSDLSIGIVREETTLVDDKNTAIAIGSGTLEVFATPAMIALLEKAAMNSVQPYLSSKYSTVGTKISVSHLKASKKGKTIKAVAKLDEINGNKLKFSVSAFDGEVLIGEGVHFRYIIEINRFMQ